MIKDELFQRWAPTPISLIPTTDSQYLINLFMKEAAINMGSNVDEQTLERVIYNTIHDFGHLPVSYIASGFLRGSLGQFGTGRLVPRTIHGWLSEVSNEYTRMIAKDDRKRDDSYYSIAYNLTKIPMGRAIIQKIDWYKQGKLPIEDWGKVPLKELAEAIGRKERILLENYYP